LVDGTMRPFCRPEEGQTSFYSGYKKTQAFKFQKIVTPNSLLSSLAGLFLGPVADCVVWHSSGIVEILQNLFMENEVSAEERLYVHGNSAYAPAFGIMGPFVEQVNKPLTREQEAANVAMSGQRIVVEWGFGYLAKYWALNSFKSSLRLGLSPIANYYMVATLLTNILLYVTGGNQVSEKYNLLPPTLEEYLYIADED